MRIKATWFIPGLLLTLLLGLLWALPTSAATGVVSALDKKGGDAVEDISAADTDGIWIQVTDSDVNTVVKYDGKGDNPDRLAVTAAADNGVLEFNELKPEQLVDRDGNGRITKADFKFFDGSDPAVELENTTSVEISLTVDYTNETVTLGGTSPVATVEAHVHEVQTLGGREIPERAFKGSNARTLPSPAAVGTTNWIDASEITAADLFQGLGLRNGASLNDLKLVPNAPTDGSASTYHDTVKAWNVIEGADDVPLKMQVSLDTSDPPVVSVSFDSNQETGVKVGQVSADDDAAVPVRFEFTLKADAMGVGDTKDGKPQSTVNVSSGEFSDGIDVVLMETGFATGVFGAMMTVCIDGTDGCSATQMPTTDELVPHATLQDDEGNPVQVPGPMTGIDGSGTGTIVVPAGKEDIVTVEYSDASPRGARLLRVAVDSNGPAFGNISPAHNTSSSDDRFTYTLDVTDSQSGLQSDDDADDYDDSIVLVWSAGDDFGNIHVQTRGDGLRESTTDGGFSVENSVRGRDVGRADANDYDIKFWAIARDLAGNIMVLDTKSGTDDAYCAAPMGLLEKLTVVDNTATDALADVNEMEVAIEEMVELLSGSKCDPHVVKVDNSPPTIAEVSAGGYRGADDDGNVEIKHAKNTSIAITFSEALDCDTVAASDFEVDGVTPNASSCSGEFVFLTVNAMDADARPEIEIVGAITDVAGNEQDEGSETATDDIKATLTVAMAGTADSGSRIVTNEKLMVTVTTDERLSAPPVAKVYKVMNDRTLGKVHKEMNLKATSGTTEYTTTFTFGEDDSGLYSLYVSGTDRGSTEMTSVGIMGNEDDPVTLVLSDDKAFLFEVDTGVKDPVPTPSHEGSDDDPNVFIRLNFSGEGDEYPVIIGDEDGASNRGDDDKADLDVDSYGSVMLTKATFDGGSYDDADVLAMFTDRGGVEHLYRPGDLAIGDYTLKVEFEDAAGNEGDYTLMFSITARQAYKLELNAGANLISFPAALEDPAVDAVFADAAITQVLTYDNSMGLWMTASRGDDGMFAGDLMMVDARHAYWVLSDAPVDVSVMLPEAGGFSTFPPAIDVYQGWNLVPVADISQSKAKTKIAAKDYFANIKWEVAYGYDPASGYQRIVKDTTGDAKVEVGMGYFVYVNEAGVIIP